MGCLWVYTVKVDHNENIDCLKSCLVEKGYTQISGLEYGGTFSPIAKIASIHFLP